MFYTNLYVRAVRSVHCAICALHNSAKLSSLKQYPQSTSNVNTRIAQEDLVNMALENVKLSATQDWEKIKQFIMNHEVNKNQFLKYNDDNIHGLIMKSLSKLKRLDLARSYICYLKEKGVNPNLATIGRYLEFLYDSNINKISKKDEQEIINICNDISKNHPVLDSITLESMALSLSLTSEWKKCINILKDIKKTSNIKTSVYSAVISAAFLHKEEKLAWDLLHEVISLDKNVLSIAYLSYLKTLKRLKKKENVIKSLEKLFSFFKDTETNCPEELVDDITQSFSLGHKTTVTFSGQCQNCATKLKKLELTDEEFATLKDVFLKNAMLGKDIFIKSNPEEMNHFQNFVSNMKKYDVVLDGLNIAYSAGANKGPQVFSKILATVVSHFVQQNKSVLVLGRVHMTRWPKRNWNYVTQNADVFLTQNISQDDPYLLYCALHSGKDTVIVSRDLMRGHKFLLKERSYKTLFDRWLSQRQYFLLYVNDRGRVSFRKPPEFCPVTQQNGNVWHIPYQPSLDKAVNELYQRTWFCLDCNNK